MIQYYSNESKEWNDSLDEYEIFPSIDTIIWEVVYREDAIIDYGKTMQNIFNIGDKNDSVFL